MGQKYLPADFKIHTLHLKIINEQIMEFMFLLICTFPTNRNASTLAQLLFDLSSHLPGWSFGHISAAFAILTGSHVQYCIPQR